MVLETGTVWLWKNHTVYIDNCMVFGNLELYGYGKKVRMAGETGHCKTAFVG